MSKFDLNNPIDFAKVTSANLTQILGSLTGRDTAQWDIQEASYNGVIFLVFQSATPYSAAVSMIRDIGGRRKVKYLFPYRDGQTLDDLGRRPETFDVNILLFGDRYLSGLQQLLREFNKPTPGELVHPVRGRIQCAPEDITLTHESEARKAVAIQVTFIENNFSIGAFRSLDDKSVKGALAKALDSFRKLDKALLSVQNARLIPQGIKNQITGLLNSYKNRYGTVLTNINQTYNLGGSQDIPTLVPVNRGGLRNPDGSIVGDNFPVVRSPNNPILLDEDLGLSETTIQALAVTQLTNEVNAVRDDAGEIIEAMNVAPLTVVTAPLGSNNQPLPQAGTLEFYENIVEIQETAIVLQETLEAGVASSQSRIIEYMTPRDMSLREVAFLNRVDVNKVFELDILNFELESTNQIPKGTTVMVPVS